MGREISAEAVRKQTFGKPPLGTRGYSEDEVDRYLQVISAALDGRSRLSANDVHNVAFKKPPVGKRGYDEDQVDAFLDAIEDQLRARERSTGAAADRSTKSATAFAETADAANDPRAAAAAADAAWYEAKFGNARPSMTSPDPRASRGLDRFKTIGRVVLMVALILLFFFLAQHGWLPSD
jgi:DivIVA domain-containing protein